MKNLILASGSPRRSAILREAGYDPVIRPADVDETLPEGISSRDAVMFLSLKKAMAAQTTLSKSIMRLWVNLLIKPRPGR